MLSIAFFIETYCVLTQGTRFSYTLFLLVLQTNHKETTEYLTANLNPILLTFITTTVIIIILKSTICLWQRSNLLHYLNSRCKPVNYIVISAAIIFIGIYSFIYCLRPYYYPIPGGQHLESIANIPLHFFSLWSDYRNQQNRFDIERLVKTNQDIKLTTNYKGDDLTLIYIIGESFNKYHSSLYGYRQVTNPRLKRYHEDGSLILLTNVVSQSQNTIFAYPPLLSLQSESEKGEFHNSKLLPAVLKRAGFKVYYLNNQSVLPTAQISKKFDASTDYFLTDSRIQNLCFDIVNDTIFQYDGELINHYTIPQNGKNLLIYHLEGQHMQAQERYPVNLIGKLHVEDYRKIGFTDKEAKIVCHYDIATIYNDSIIADIIEKHKNKNAVLIYLSDHGDEIYDYGERYGRRQNDNSNPVAIKLCYEIPAMIWVSKKFSNENPEKTYWLKRNKNVPLYSGDITKTILDLANVRIKGVDSKFSLISDSIGRRNRIIGPDKFPYDKNKSKLEKVKLRGFSYPAI